MNGAAKVLGIAVIGLCAGSALAEDRSAAPAKNETTRESTYEATGAAAKSPEAKAEAEKAAASANEQGVKAEEGIGGSGDPVQAPGSTSRTETTTEESLDSPANGGSTDPNAQTPSGAPGSDASHVRKTSRTTTTQYSQSPSAPVGTLDDSRNKKRGPNYRGMQVMLGGGVEGYTGSLASRVRPGAAYGATVAFKPTSVLGLEVGYTGAVNELSSRVSPGIGGADVVRNGVQGIATFGLSATAVQPYVLAGIGINRYNVRAPASSGFRDDTSGNIPLGGGVRSYIGPVIIDARVTWNVLFANDFATTPGDVAVADSRVTTSGGRYLGTISAGAAF